MTIDLSKGRHSLSEVLGLARTEAILIHAPSGEDFLLEQADAFDREAAELGSSEEFWSLLESRSKETGDVPLRQVLRKRRP
jgi:hypothetical protein